MLPYYCYDNDIDDKMNVVKNINEVKLDESEMIFDAEMDMAS